MQGEPQGSSQWEREMRDMKRRRGLDIVFFPILLVAGAACAAPPSREVFQDRTVSLGDGTDFTYQVFLPAGWTSDRAWPVILFLHGAGERGSDGVAHTRVGLPPRLLNQPEFGAVVVFPQCPRGTWWGAPAVEARVFAVLEDALSHFHGDRRRIYLTGLSLGGYGTWAFGFKYPGKFAALVPVCGGVSSRARIPPPHWHPAAQAAEDIFALTARGIGRTPVWAFHGEVDPVIPVSESRRLVEALRSAGGDVRFTEYPGVGHDSWDAAYSESELWEWLFQQKLPQ